MNGVLLGAKLLSPQRNEKVKQSSAPGSLIHIAANNKLENKGEVTKEIIKEQVKDTVSLGGIVVGTGIGTGTAVGLSNKLTNGFKNMKHSIGEVLGELGCLNYNPEKLSIKDAITETKVYKKFAKLSTPAQAAILAGVAALAIATPIISLISASKAGYIEGQNEVK